MACSGSEGDIGDCPKTCGGHGCSHQNDVGICCWGLQTGAVLERKNLRGSFDTVKGLRDMCYLPKACDEPGRREKKIEFHSSCDYGGAEQELILGDYERLGYPHAFFFFSSLLLASLELSDTTIYGPAILALLATAPRFHTPLTLERGLWVVSELSFHLLQQVWAEVDGYSVDNVHGDS